MSDLSHQRSPALATRSATAAKGSRKNSSQLPDHMTTHPPVPHICFWHRWVTGAVHSCTPDGASLLLQHMRGVTDGSCVGQSRSPPKFGGRRCEHGSAATRDCSRLVEACSGACFFNRVQVRWTQVCAYGRSQKRCRAIKSGL